jgi:hypothetical protein
LDRAELDAIIESSLSNTLKTLGEDCLPSVKSLLSRGRGLGESLVANLGDIDAVLDELFGKFSKIIKHITILQVSMQLKRDPPSLGGSLLWMIEELRSSLWKAQS